MKNRCFQITSFTLAVICTFPGSASAQSPSRNEVTHYQDDIEHWILGQPVAVVINGVTAESRQFDRGRLLQLSVFGRIVQQLEYGIDGTLSVYRDGNGSATLLGEWKRGIPQRITFPDGTVQSAHVDDSGRINSVTDQNGFVTAYTHDLMGRLTQIDYPAGGPIQWNSVHGKFEQVATEELGLGPGHWRQTVSHGDALKITYFDALWRPVISHEYDASNQVGTQRYKRQAYDSYGRETFSSYASATPSLGPGIGRAFDQLGRPTGVVQDSEIGPLVTLIDYLPTSVVKTTDPLGSVTLTAFQQFEQPSYEIPISIEHPEGASTRISRDVFGKVVSIERQSGDGVVNLRRDYVYDARHLLCKQIEPESGATVMDYDGAGNLIRSSSGLKLPSLTDCNHDLAAISGRSVVRSYDQMGRLTSVLFPDGNGDQILTYTPDGLPQEIITSNDGGGTQVVNTYEYNSRRLIGLEKLDLPGGISWSMEYIYDSNGAVTKELYPGGLVVDYAPNGLGQATRAGAYASNIAYHPDGSVKQFTYGNGIVRTLNVNMRGLRSRTIDSNILDVTATYDAAGNTISLRGGVAGSDDFQNGRDMQYDGQGRLVHVDVHGRLQERFSYDALDNRLASGRLIAGDWNDRTYVYDVSNRLTNVQDSAGGSVVGLAYDDQGNLALRNGEAFGFDYGNRMRTSAGASYRYDGYGRRVAKQLASGETEFSFYAHDGQLRYQSSLADNTHRAYISLAGTAIARVINDDVVVVPEPTPAPTSAPVLTGPAISSGQIDITWTSVEGATTYRLEERAASDWAVVQSAPATAWSVSGKPPGSYEYRASACNEGGCGPVSAIFVVPVSASAPPAAPENVTLRTERYDWDMETVLRWSASEGATSYELKLVSMGTGSEQIEALPMTLIRIWNHRRDLIPLAEYFVRACNPSACSDWVLAN